ncbi:MAG: hypothetical protein WBV94_25600 [Blastocatellia bacterium]
MANLKTHRINQTVLLLAVCAISAMFGFALRDNETVAAKSYPPILLQQSDEKVIETYERDDDLLEFGNLSVKNTRIVPYQKFSANLLAEKGGGQAEDWLENLEFSLRNKSDKQIIYIQVELQFPDTATNGGLLMVYREFCIGIHPKSGSTLKNIRPLALNPGATTTATLSRDHLQRIKNFVGLKNFQLTDINKVVVKILAVIFDDGVMWSSGHYFRANPAAPGGYELISTDN